jgi:hypothetical protein
LIWDVGFQRRNQSEMKCHVPLPISLEVKEDTQRTLVLCEVKGGLDLNGWKPASKGQRGGKRGERMKTV